MAATLDENCNFILCRMARRATDSAAHKSTIKDQFLTPSQQRQRSRWHAARTSMAGLNILNLNSRVGRLLVVQDDHKRMCVLIATQRIPRLHQLVSTMRKQGCSVRVIIDQIDKAMRGLYHPKGYDSDDLDMAILVYRLGNRQLLYALNRTHGFPSESYLHRMLHDMPSFLVCSGELSLRTMRDNLEAIIFSKTVPTERCAWVLMMDDVNIDERIRFNTQDGEGRGFCREHTRMDLKVNSARDIDAWKEALDAGLAHCAKELTVVALGPLREKEYAISPIFASGTCKAGESAEHTNWMIKNLVLMWYEDPRGYQARGPITTTNSDGAACFVSGVHELLDEEVITFETDPKLYDILSKLNGFCLYVSSHTILKRLWAATDMKHAGKRFRGRLISAKGIQISKTEGCTFNSTFLRSLLGDFGMGEFMLSGHEIDQLFNLGPAERMHVPTFLKLMKAVSQVLRCQASQFQRGAYFEGIQWPALQVLIRALTACAIMGCALIAVL
jgi:hypothetical protein